MVDKPGICQSGWYVFGICQKKKPYAVYNAVNTCIGMWLKYESHRKVILLRISVYEVVYDKSGIPALHGKKAVYSRILIFFLLWYL